MRLMGEREKKNETNKFLVVLLRRCELEQEIETHGVLCAVARL